MAAMGMTVCGIIMAMMIMGAAAQAPAPSVDCVTVVLTLTDCLSFVTGNEKTPPAACCSELSSVITNSPQCLCLLFNTTFTGSLGVNISIAQAQQLPPACNLTTPPTSLCSVLGVPVPSPVSSASSPMASSPTSPSSSPLSPMSPSSSPSTAPSSSPSTAPAGSIPSSPSLTAPAGSPLANDSTTAPSPSSAPSVMYQNAAAAAASLLFLASIFIS